MTRTFPGDVADVRVARRARAIRRAFITLIVLVLLAGLSGVLGVRSGVVSVAGDGYRLTVTYAQVTRPGLATPFSIAVERPAGFTDEIVLEVSSTFLDAFDENGLDPEPVTSESDGTWVRWGFDPPAGTRLEVSFDARLEPAVQWKRPGATRLVIADRVVAEVTWTMWVMP